MKRIMTVLLGAAFALAGAAVPAHAASGLTVAMAQPATITLGAYAKISANTERSAWCSLNGASRKLVGGSTPPGTRSAWVSWTWKPGWTGTRSYTVRCTKLGRVGYVTKNLTVLADLLPARISGATIVSDGSLIYWWGYSQGWEIHSWTCDQLGHPCWTSNYYPYRVYLQRYDFSRRLWLNVDSTTTSGVDADGGYVSSWTWYETGSYRIYVSPTARHAAAISAVTRF